MSDNNILIVGKSALQFWMDYSKRLNPDNYSYTSCKRISPPERFSVQTTSNLIRKIADSLGLCLPLCIMKPSGTSRYSSADYKCITLPKHIPKNSFVKLGEGMLPEDLQDLGINIYVASPEYCFLAAASELTIPQLVELGCNLCANYAIDSKNAQSQSFRAPISKAAIIKNFISEAENNKGLYKARKAAKYICDGSNSPMESRLAVVSILPFFLGGLNMHKPDLNKEIDLSLEGAAVLGRKTCKCDIVWEEQKLIIEYDSNKVHLTAEQHAYDKKKATALMLSGYKVISITYEDIKNVTKIENMLKLIRKELNMKNRKGTIEEYKDIRRKTIMELFFSNKELW